MENLRRILLLVLPALASSSCLNLDKHNYLTDDCVVFSSWFLQIPRSVRNCHDFHNLSSLCHLIIFLSASISFYGIAHFCLIWFDHLTPQLLSAIKVSTQPSYHHKMRIIKTICCPQGFPHSAVSYDTPLKPHHTSIFSFVAFALAATE
jgi:hypothetical protein